MLNIPKSARKKVLSGFSGVWELFIWKSSLELPWDLLFQPIDRTSCCLYPYFNKKATTKCLKKNISKLTQESGESVNFIFYLKMGEI